MGIFKTYLTYSRLLPSLAQPRNLSTFTVGFPTAKF